MLGGGKKAPASTNQAGMPIQSPDNTNLTTDKSAFQKQLMGGTSYESNNVFKLINRQTNNNSQTKKDNQQSMSPPLRAIVEEGGKNKIIIGASST